MGEAFITRRGGGGGGGIKGGQTFTKLYNDSAGDAQSLTNILVQTSYNIGIGKVYPYADWSTVSNFIAFLCVKTTNGSATVNLIVNELNKEYTFTIDGVAVTIYFAAENSGTEDATIRFQTKGTATKSLNAYFTYMYFS